MNLKDSAKQIKVGVVLSYFQMALNIVIGIIYTPIMIHKFGQSEYGLYNTAASTISMLSILSLGFGSGYLRYYAKYKAKNDDNSIYKLNGLFLLIFTIIGMIALIIGFFLTEHLELVYDTGLTESEYGIARILMFLLTINLAVSFPMSVFNTILSANERFIFQKVLNMGKTIISPLVTIPLLFAGMKSIAVVSVTVLLAFVVDVFNIWYVLVKLKDKFYFRNFEKGIFKSMFVYTSFIMLNTISRQINWNIDKLLLGRLQGTAAVAVYAVASTLHTYYENFSTSVSNVFRTRVHLIVNMTNNDKQIQRSELTTLFIKVGRVQFLILGLILTGFIFFGESFITQFWAGAEYRESYFVAILLMFPASIQLIQNIGIDVQRALNKHQFRSIAYMFMSILNLVMSIFLCQIYGAVGAAFGTAVSLVVVDGFVMNIFYQKECNIDIISFWGNMGRLLLGLIVPILTGLLIHIFIKFDNVFVYLGCIVLYVAIYIISMWLFAMNEGEKNFVRNIAGKIRRRIT